MTEILTPEMVEKQKSMMKLSQALRGAIMEHFVNMETIIETNIADYFTSNHVVKSRQLLFALIMQEMFNFHNKKRMIIFIMKNGFPDFYKQNSHLDERLSEANSFRNIIAHRKIDMRPNVINSFDGNNINLVSYTTKHNSPSPSLMTINKEIITKIAQEFINIGDKMLELADLIKKGTSMS